MLYKNRIHQKRQYLVILLLCCTSAGFIGIMYYYTSAYKELPDIGAHELDTSLALTTGRDSSITSTLTDCLSGEVLFKVIPNLIDKPFTSATPLSANVETNAQRMASFENIYKEHIWGYTDRQYKGMQGSGEGSSSHFARRFMKLLSKSINRIKKITGKQSISLLDVACGDMVWMQEFLAGRDDIIYTGWDIVPQLVKSHQVRFKEKQKNWSFGHVDVVKQAVNKSYDLVLCRHMLQHLSIADAMRVLEHLSNSGSSFLIATTWPTTRENQELQSTASFRFRPLNLELPPFQITPPICIAADWADDSNEWLFALYAGLWKLPLRQLDDALFGASKTGDKLTYTSRTNRFSIYAKSYRKLD